MSKIISAAGVVLLRNNEVLLVHRPRYDDWSFPKGKVDGAELLPLTAVRECDEETGFLAVLGPHIGVDPFFVNVAAYQLGGPYLREDLGFAPVSPHLPSYGVASHLTYPTDLEFLQRALVLPPTSPLVILRHAKAVKRSDFTGKHDSDRPLSGRGRRQAKIIVEALEGYGIERVISSPMQRCQETVKKFVKQLSTTPILVDALSESGYEQHPQNLQPAIELAMGNPAPTVLCSHRPVLDAILKTVATAGGVSQVERIEEIWSTNLSPGSFFVAHRQIDAEGTVKVVAIEHHEVPGNQES